jgi:hypothetical protein
MSEVTQKVVPRKFGCPAVANRRRVRWEGRATVRTASVREIRQRGTTSDARRKASAGRRRSEYARVRGRRDPEVSWGVYREHETGRGTLRRRGLVLDGDRQSAGLPRNCAVQCTQ